MLLFRLFSTPWHTRISCPSLSQSLLRFMPAGSVVGLLATSKRTYASLPRLPLLAPHPSSRQQLTHGSTGDPQTLTGRSGSVCSRSLHLSFLVVLCCCTRALSSCGAQASHLSGFSFCRVQALEYLGFSSYRAQIWLPHHM